MSRRDLRRILAGCGVAGLGVVVFLFGALGSCMSQVGHSGPAVQTRAMTTTRAGIALTATGAVLTALAVLSLVVSVVRDYRRGQAPIPDARDSPDDSPP